MMKENGRSPFPSVAFQTGLLRYSKEGRVSEQAILTLREKGWFKEKSPLFLSLTYRSCLQGGLI